MTRSLWTILQCLSCLLGAAVTGAACWAYLWILLCHLPDDPMIRLGVMAAMILAVWVMGSICAVCLLAAVVTISESGDT